MTAKLTHLSKILAGLFAATTVHAGVCDVSLISLQTTGEALLKANCGDGVSSIEWFRDANSLSGGAATPLGYTTDTATLGSDIYFSSTIYPGTHIYKATAPIPTTGPTGKQVAIIATDRPPVVLDAPNAAGSVNAALTNINLADYVKSAHGTVTYSIKSGALPAGVTLNTSTGVISGTPTSVGSTTVTWTATDANGDATPTDSITFNVAAVPPPTIGNMSDKTGIINTAIANISLATVVSNSHGAVTYSIKTGALPAGLSLDASTGVISGTPTATGTSTITWTATDSNGEGTPADSITFTISAVPPPTIGNMSDKTGIINTAIANISLATVVTNTHGAVTYSIKTGALPAGLSLDASTGIISGTPTAIGTSTITWTATDSNGEGTPADSITFTIAAVAPPTIGNMADKSGTVNIAIANINLSTVVTNSHGTVTYSIKTGALPAGLSLDASTGVISGTPTTAGSSTITWTATDSNGEGTPADSIGFTIAAAGSCPASEAGFTIDDWPNYTNSTNVLIRVLPASSGLALRFTPSTTAYPLGVLLSDLGIGSKSYSISKCPGVMDLPVNAQNGSGSVNADAYVDNCNNTFGIRYPGYAGTLVANTYCYLAPADGPYYLNIRNPSTTSTAELQLKNGKYSK